MKSNNYIELRWHGKDEMEDPEPRLLIEKNVYSSGQKGIDDNLLIYGDNLLGLKSLEKKYTGKIKCIYIDPPYNTKSAFKHYKDNLEHSLWLNMMKERLHIMHKLLKEDGTIWISIDDDECHYLKVLCDEIFGRKNFVDTIIWEKVHTRKNSSKYLSSSHDFILCYSKNKFLFKRNLLDRTQYTAYKNPDNDPNGPWKLDPIHASKVYSAEYSIKKPNGHRITKPNGRYWRYSKESIDRFISEDKIVWGKGKALPMVKRYLKDVQEGLVPTTIWFKQEVGHNAEAKKEVLAFNSQDVFQTPKPERLLQRIIHLATNPGDIVLDSFAGSGTTGAVAHKMKRRWIMIELGEHCHSHIIPRMEKVINGEDPGGVTEITEWKGGGSFRYCEMENPLCQ